MKNKCLYCALLFNKNTHINWILLHPKLSFNTGHPTLLVCAIYIFIYLFIIINLHLQSNQNCECPICGLCSRLHIHTPCCWLERVKTTRISPPNHTVPASCFFSHLRAKTSRTCRAEYTYMYVHTHTQTHKKQSAILELSDISNSILNLYKAVYVFKEMAIIFQKQG